MDLAIIIILSLLGIGAGLALIIQIIHWRVLFQQYNVQIHPNSLSNLNEINV